MGRPGHQALMSELLTVFFSSRQCPGTAIRAAMDWALEQARTRQPVVSGFHSPLEQLVLTVLLQARYPVAGARLPPEWTEPLAAQRNEWVAALARQIVVAHASPGGQLAELCDEWTRAGRFVRRLG